MYFAIRLIFVGILELDAPSLATGIGFPPVGPDKKWSLQIKLLMTYLCLGKFEFKCAVTLTPRLYV